MATDRDDPLFEYILVSRLQPYIPAVREWWANIENLKPTHTGTFGITNAPPGLSYRFTKSEKKSVIPGIQAFPYVPTGYLQITGITGGAIKMIERLCKDDYIKIEEFQIIAKNNLPSTIASGQFIAFVPIDILADAREKIGQWVYLTNTELMYLAIGHVTKEVQDKVKLRIV